MRRSYCPLAHRPHWGTPSVFYSTVIRKAGRHLQENKEFGNRNTEFSVERTLSQNKKPRLIQQSCFLVGILHSVQFSGKVGGVHPVSRLAAPCSWAKTGHGQDVDNRQKCGLSLKPPILQREAVDPPPSSHRLPPFQTNRCCRCGIQTE